MKQNLWLFLLLASLIFVSCKKDNDSDPAGVTSRWTFEGKTFTVTDASYAAGSNELFASDDHGAVGGGNFVRVFFGSSSKPTGSITLTIVDAASSGPSTCVIQAGNLYGANPIQYLSTGKTGDKVTLTVSSSGKLSTSFSNITVSDGTNIKTVSGTLVEQ